MLEAKRNQIDLILSEITDKGLSPQRVQKLDSLLRDQPDSQDHYLQAIELLLLLEHEFDYTLRDPAPLLNLGPQSHAAGRDHLHHSPKGPHYSQRWPTDSNCSKPRLTGRFGVLLLATAATLLVGWTALGPDRESGVREVAVDTLPPIGPIDSRYEAEFWQPVIRDVDALTALSQVTRTALVTSLYLPQRATDGTPRVSLCSGTAWMERGYGERGRGHVFTLLPGQTMSLQVSTNAASHNSLALIELARQSVVGDAIKLNFSSLVDVNAPSPRQPSCKQHHGQVGTYTTTNTSPSPKHFLLVGSHAARGRAAQETWLQSDFQVAFADTDLLVIGWDDSGYGNPKQPPPYAWEPDRDYDDIQAVIRFSPAEAASEYALVPNVRLRPDIDTVEKDAPESTEAHTLVVAPGKERVLIVTSSTSVPTRVQIVDSDSRQVLWQLDGEPASETDFLRSTVNGCYTITNSSDRPYRIEVQGSHVEPDEAGEPVWHASPSRWQSVTDSRGTVFLSHLDSESRGVTVQTLVFPQ